MGAKGKGATGGSLPAADAPASAWAGVRIGERTVGWSDRDPILFALAVGARPEQLDLVFEERLQVLPTFALTLAQWAPDILGSAGAWEIGNALHAGQRLRVLRPLPISGEIAMAARVSSVWDKGSAAVYEVSVESDYFVATWSIFAPGRGGFGGERGPGTPPPPTGSLQFSRDITIAENAALLYRLLGDRHHIHVDPGAASRIGQPRPILHGLATLSAATLALAEQRGASPADLTWVEGRFAAPVFPGDVVTVRGWESDVFEVATSRGTAIKAGGAAFG